MAATKEATRYMVELRVEPVGECPIDVIEDVAIDMADAIDAHTSDAVHGAAVSVAYDPPAIEVDLELDTESLAAMHRVLAEVMQVLEDQLGFQQIANSGYAEHVRRAPVPA